MFMKLNSNNETTKSTFCIYDKSQGIVYKYEGKITAKLKCNVKFVGKHTFKATPKSKLLDEYVNFTEHVDTEYFDGKTNDMLLFDKTKSTFGKSDTFKHLCDEKLDKTLFDQGLEIFNGINVNEMVEINSKEFYDDDVAHHVTKSFFYRCDNTYLFYVDMVMKFDCYSECESDCDCGSDRRLFGIINTDSKKCLFTGCQLSHPFIVSNNFVYLNSDGSGPEINIEEGSPNAIYNRMLELYNAFSANKYH